MSTAGTADLGFQAYDDSISRRRHPAYSDWYTNWFAETAKCTVAPVLPDAPLAFYWKGKRPLSTAPFDFVGGRFDAGSLKSAVSMAILLTDNPHTIPGAPAFCETWSVFQGELVASLGSVISDVFSPPGGQPQFGILLFYNGAFFEVWAQALSNTGTPNVQIQILETPFDTAPGRIKAPFAGYTMPDVGGTVGTIADTKPHVYVVNPSPMV